MGKKIALGILSVIFFGRITFSQGNYTYSISEYNWVELEGIVEPLANVKEAGNIGPFDIGFEFPFYNEKFNQFRLCGDGFISFTSSSYPYQNTSLPNISAPENLIAIFWTDLDSSKGKVYYYNDKKRLIIEWKNVIWYNTSTSVYTFEIILYPDGKITYQYKSMIGKLDTQTVGIQNISKDKGLQITYNTFGKKLTNELAIDIFPFWFPDNTPPYVSNCKPAKGAIAAKNTNITIELKDDGEGINKDSIKLKVNGKEVNPVITGNKYHYILTYDPPEDFVYKEVVNISIDAEDLFSPVANVMPQVTYFFTISASEIFTLIVLPDTQDYTISYPESFIAQTQWIKDHKDEYNILFVLHEGDITEGSHDFEWERAKNSMSILDGIVPYILAVGNHDNYKDFNKHFPTTKFNSYKWYGGHMEGREQNRYVFFEKENIEFMIISLEFGAPDNVLKWANEVVSSYPNKKTIVLTHCYMYTDNTRVGPGDKSNPHNYFSEANDGEDMWEKFVKQHKNIFLVLSGHIVKQGNATGKLTSESIYHNKVHQLLANYQAEGGVSNEGWLRIMQFILPTKIEVSTYSPVLDKYREDLGNKFELELNWEELSTSFSSLLKPTVLHQNYPNPFNPKCWIPYTIEGKGLKDVKIKIYNVLGQVIRQINLGNKVKGEYLTKDKAAYWDGKDNYGKEVSRGIYFYELEVNNKSIGLKKSLVLK